MTMSRKYFLGLIGLALLIGVWGLYQKEAPTQSQPQAPTSVQTNTKKAPSSNTTVPASSAASNGILTLPAGVRDQQQPCSDVTASEIQLNLNEPVTFLCSGSAEKSWLIVYSLSRKTPLLTLQKLQGPFGDTERSKEFHEETVIDSRYRATLQDYGQRSQAGLYYDRGHLVPAADIPQIQNYKQVMDDTFSLANIAPQSPEFNRGTWAKSVELATRKYAKRNPTHEIYVYTGISGVSDRVGQVAVPAFFYKIVVDKTTQRSWLYFLPNSEQATEVLNTNGLYTVSQLNQLLTDYQLTLKQ